MTKWTISAPCRPILWAYPAVSFESIRVGAKRDLGTDLNDFVIADNYADPKAVWLTANDTTIYALTNIDLAKSGPLVVEIPPGAIVGMIDDFWQRSLTDVGLPGPDGRERREVSPAPARLQGRRSADRLSRPSGNNEQPQHDDPRHRPERRQGRRRRERQEGQGLSAERKRQSQAEQVRLHVGQGSNTLPPKGMEFWERLSAVINNNPVQERDLFYMAMLKPLGIEKGRPFKPDARQQEILEEAARMGDAMGRVMLFEGPDRFRQVGEGLGVEPFPGTKWHWVFQVNPVQQTDTYGQIDERLHYTYGAIYTTPALGVMKAGPGWQLHPGVQGQGRQPLRRREEISSARARERAGRAVLVADAL